MVSLRQSHFRPCAPSVFWLKNHQWLRGPRHSLASGAFPLPMPWLFAEGTWITTLPPVPLLSTQGTLALYGHPRALWSARARLAQKSRLPLWWSLSGQSHCNHLGHLHISLGVFSLFWPYPYYWKPNKPIGTNNSLTSEDQQLLSEFCTWCLGQTGLWNA